MSTPTSEFESRSDIHGSATLFTSSPLSLSPIFDEGGSTAMLLGHNPDDHSKGMAYAVGPKGTSKGHALTFGRTRGGKGVSTIIPALLTYKGSMVVIDPKGENAWVTAERRRQLGQRVVILDPWNEVNYRYGSKAGVTEQITQFNPLSALRPEDDDFADEVTAIAEAFIYQTGNDPHWSDSARELVAGLIAAEVQNNPGKASMRSVRKLLRAPMDFLRDTVNDIIERHPDSLAAGKLAAFVEKDEGVKAPSGNEISSIRSSARTQTAFLDSAALATSMETDNPPFDLAELATGKVTLYLVLPVNKLRSHGRWLRLILTLAIGAIAAQPEPPELPVTFLLDELGTISPGSGLSMIEQSYGLMAGLGIRIWAFLQDLPQLKRDYPNSWETFISNASVIQLLNVADTTTATYFANYLGNATVNAKNGDWGFRQKQYKPGTSYEGFLRKQMVNRLLKRFPDTGEERAIKLVNESRNGESSLNHDKTMDMGRIFDNAQKDLSTQGFTLHGYSEWEEGVQPASRPIRFPWEVVDTDPDKTLLIFPGRGNAELVRYVYYSDPILSKWARPDPRYPVAAPNPTPIPTPAAPQRQFTPIPPPASPPPYSAPSQQPVDGLDELKDVATDAAKRAAGWLKDRMGGR